MTGKRDSHIFLTVADQITDYKPCYLTGNEYLSLPNINQGGGIVELNIVHLGWRGLLEFFGGEEEPLIAPLLSVDDQTIDLGEQLSWSYKLNWIPTFTMETANGLAVQGEIVTPPGFKGFYYSLQISNKGSAAIRVQAGWQGCWNSFNYIVFNRRAMEGKRTIAYDSWTRSVVLEAFEGPPLAALALAVDPESEWHLNAEEKKYCALDEMILEPGASYKSRLYVAVNLEADGAGTTAVDLRRHGSEALNNFACTWLESHSSKLDDPFLNNLLDRNLFFSYFFALARSLDSEELVPVTSRSPRYYVSAAFWSRDTLLWSFPAIEMADPGTARELLLTVFERHIRNAGDHAHYINGTVLYPGFELDQLAAFFLSLGHYLRQSGDESILDEAVIQRGLNILTEKAFDRFDPNSGLYSTFLDPSDDPAYFPYLTYNNALLESAFRFLAGLQQEEKWQHKSDFAILASELQRAVYEHCTVKGPFGMMFAWAVDSKGKFSLYDNPPGSLQLLAHYGFCSLTDPIFINTVHWIRSSNNEHFHHGCSFEETGSRHAGNPWPLSACNDLLACNAGALDFFNRAEMDNGFFCETIDPASGKVTTGAAFASGAGFLAYSLKNRILEDRCHEAEANGDHEARIKPDAGREE